MFKAWRSISKLWNDPSKSLVAVLAVSLSSISLLPQCRGERPNVLLIVSEDNGQELGCYGDPFVQTPALDRLAGQGVRFQNAYVPQAGCSQSRAAFFTGLFPHQNGQIGLATWKFRMYQEDPPNLVKSLHEAGYRTGLIGKLHVNPSDAFPFDFRAIKTANFARKDLAQYVEQAREFIEGSEQPFFLSVNYPDAHRPFTTQVEGLPAKPLLGEDVRPLPYFGIDTPELRQDTADYYNCMNRLDTLIGHLLEALETSGKANDTLVIYVGDHGADLLRGKRTSYEGGLRVPLIVRLPGAIEAGGVRNELVSTLDLYPTLLEVTSADPVEKLAGRSLVPLFKSSGEAWRQFLFTEYHLHSAHNFYPQRTVRNARYKLIQNLQPGRVNPGYDFTMQRFFPGLVDAVANAPEPIRSAYASMRQPVEFELYDLQTDPYEFKNLAPDRNYAAELRELQDALQRWRYETGDPLLDEGNLRRLQSEIEACFEDGTPQKSNLNLSYPEYFFSSDPDQDTP